jgi:hypothetical protein
MTAGSAITTAYKNPVPRMTIMRTAKQTTKTNHKGTVIVTFDRKLNLEELRFDVA